jgi:hypothetical protein
MMTYEEEKELLYLYGLHLVCEAEIAAAVEVARSNWPQWRAA